VRAAFVIAGKDLRQRLRDRSALLTAIVVPLVLASIFHNTIGGRVTFTFGLVDQDHGPVAQAFVSDALEPLQRSGLITIRREPTLAARPPGLTKGLRERPRA
jgi:ABC-2 type transport system permease protein